jgi:hypothetical protein
MSDSFQCLKGVIAVEIVRDPRPKDQSSDGLKVATRVDMLKVESG